MCTLLCSFIHLKLLNSQKWERGEGKEAEKRFNILVELWESKLASKEIFKTIQPYFKPYEWEYEHEEAKGGVYKTYLKSVDRDLKCT